MIQSMWKSMASAGVLAVLAGLIAIKPEWSESAWIVAGCWFLFVVLMKLIHVWHARSLEERALWLAAYCGGAVGWTGYLLSGPLSLEGNGLSWLLAEGLSAAFGLGVFWGMGPPSQLSASRREEFLLTWPYRASLGLVIWTSWLYLALVPAGLGQHASPLLVSQVHGLLAVIWVVSFAVMISISSSGFWRHTYFLLTLATAAWQIGLAIRPQSWPAAMALGILAMAFVVTGIGAQSKNRKSAARRPQKVLGTKLTSFLIFWIAVFLPLLMHAALYLVVETDPKIWLARQCILLLHTVVMAIMSVCLWWFNKRYVASFKQYREEERNTNRKVHELLEHQIIEKSNKLDQTKFFLQEEISLRRKLADMVKQRDERYRILVETMNEGVAVLTRDMYFSYVNDALCRMLGYPESELIDRRIVDFFDPENRAIVKAQWEKRALGVEEPYEVVWTAKRGRKVVTQISPRNIYDDEGNQVGSFSVVTDMTERKRVENELRIQLQYDPLTGLVNRTLFTERLDRALLAARRDSHNVAVLQLDLDRFKRINDSLGHEVGDALLAAVAKRLEAKVDDWDTVARLGADEFALVFTNIGNPMEVVSRVERIQSAFSTPYSLRGRDVTITSSIGISIWPSDGHSAQVLMNNADAAMYHAKSMGRDGYQFYTDALNKAAFQRLEIENQLRRAFDRDELVLHYQPKVDLANGRIVGVEALVRWQHKERGLLLPNLFIPIAEETGLIDRLSDWLLEEACRQAKVWQDLVDTPIVVGVNVSASQFSSEDMIAKVLSALAKAQLDPEFLELEITESMAMENVERSVNILEQLRALGVGVALDDFGTGHASLNYIKRFCFRAVKMDRCFIEDVESDQVDAAIVKAIIEMGHGLGLVVIAEGVENQAQLEFLRTHHCDQIQGFYICKPLAAEAIESLLKRPVLVPPVS